MASDDQTLTAAEWKARYFDLQGRYGELQARCLESQTRCLQLEGVVEELRALVGRQDQRIKELERKLQRSRKDSSNSSKPPSSDIVKPKKGHDETDARRPRGGQPGHPMHDRPEFGPAQIHARQVHALPACPCCGGAVVPTDNSPRVVQKVELTEQVPWTVTQHEAGAFFCARCGKVHYAELPAEVERGGLLGPKLMALIAYLKGVHHASFSTIRRHFKDVLKLEISRGRLAKAVQQVAQSLKHVHDQLRARLVEQESVGIDETGHKDQGWRYWTWCFRTRWFTWFHIDASRSSQTLFDVLGEQFEGVIGCDYFSAYRKYMGECGVLVQFCLAHLIRELKYMAGLCDRATATYAQRLLDHVRELFRVIHQGQRSPAQLRARLEPISAQIIRSATTRAPRSPEAQAMATRFRKHGQAYFQFITTPGIEPTNNLVEQAIRFVVIDRHITQGTRGEKGQRWCERIWTVLATCAQQGRSAMQFLIDATTAWVQGAPPPTLVPIAT